MDAGRYRQQRWDTGSALEGYNGVRKPDFRVGRPFGRRGFVDGGLPRESVYPRAAFERELLDRERCPRTSAHENWSQPRRTLDDEISYIREARRHERVGYADRFQNTDRFSESDNFSEFDDYSGTDCLLGYGFERIGQFGEHYRESLDRESFDHRSSFLQRNREDSFERDCKPLSKHADHYSGNDKRRRVVRHKWESEHEKRDRTRDNDKTREKRRHDHSRSYGHDDFSRSRSPREHSQGKSRKEGSFEDVHTKMKNEKRRDLDDKYNRDHVPVVPSATLVVKGLSHKTTEDDLYQAIDEWGPLRPVRVIKERNTGLSRGFAFVDFPSIEAAQKIMDEVGKKGLVVDGRHLFFEYSSKPTGGLRAPQAGQLNSTNGSNQGSSKGSTLAIDWMCTLCGCANFARRMSCFQCNESRAEDSTPADVVASNQSLMGKKGCEPGPTHVLVVRGLDEHIDEEMLHYEFSKHAPIKDLHLVRDKFTHVSRGFAFVHFHLVEEASKALEATNGMALERNGQTLRVAFAKNILGPGTTSSAVTHANNLAAAAIEAATFAQQYDAVGWAPKEFNQDEGNANQQTVNNSGTGTNGAGCSELENTTAASAHTAPQSQFVWDEASGYYYDAASGFYYDGHSGLYYDGNNGIWYSYSHESQQYTPCVDQSAVANVASGKNERTEKASESVAQSKMIVSAPAVTIVTNSEASDKKPSLPEAVQAAATAAQAATKKERERMKEKEKEIKLASKSSILASKKKINNVLSMWKKRQNEGQAACVVLDAGPTPAPLLASVVYKGVTSGGVGSSGKIVSTAKLKHEVVNSKKSGTEEPIPASCGIKTPFSTSHNTSDSPVAHRPVSNSSGGTVMGVIRESRRTAVKATGSSHRGASEAPAALPNLAPEKSTVASAFKTDASALGSYGPMAGTKRRFSGTPQTAYRDRAAERRCLHGSFSPGDGLSDIEIREKGTLQR